MTNFVIINFSLNIIWLVKSRSAKWTEHVTSVREDRCVHGLVGQGVSSYPLERPRYRRKETRYGLDGSGLESRWGARFSAPVQTGPAAHPASYTMGTGSFPGVKRPMRGVEHPPPSSSEVEGRVELYICSPSGPSWPVIGRKFYRR